MTIATTKSKMTGEDLQMPTKWCYSLMYRIMRIVTAHRDYWIRPDCRIGEGLPHEYEY